MRSNLTRGILIIPTALTLIVSASDDASAQCRPGYNCGPGTRSYVGPRQPMIMARPMQGPVMRPTVGVARAFPAQTARAYWNDPRAQRVRQVWNNPPVRDIRGIYSTGKCLASEFSSVTGCAGAASYMAYNGRRALTDPQPMTTPAYIINGQRYYYNGPGTTATTSPPMFPRRGN